MNQFFVTCERGAEGALRRELVQLRIRAPRGARGGVSFEAPFLAGMRVCMYARTAMRVLMQLAEFPAPEKDALYQGVMAIDWSSHLDARKTFAVRAHASGTEGLDHTGFVALKAKDAIVDRLREQIGARPDVDTRDPDVTIAIHLHSGTARVFLDLAGVPLHRRGYRVAMTESPLKETLAAAVLSLADVPADRPFLDPMAGSGTFAIEHAMRVRQMAPGAKRSFGFERWPTQIHAEDLRHVRQEAEENVLPDWDIPIHCRDVSADAIAAAKNNARAAGVMDQITFEVASLAQLSPPAPAGSLCTNPPYEERTQSRGRSKKDPTRELARVLSLFRGWQVSVLAPEQGLSLALGQQADFTHRLENGGIPVQLQRFTLGSPDPTAL